MWLGRFLRNRIFHGTILNFHFDFSGWLCFCCPWRRKFLSLFHIHETCVSCKVDSLYRWTAAASLIFMFHLSHWYISQIISESCIYLEWIIRGAVCRKRYHNNMETSSVGRKSFDSNNRYLTSLFLFLFAFQECDDMNQPKKHNRAWNGKCQMK